MQIDTLSALYITLLWNFVNVVVVFHSGFLFVIMNFSLEHFPFTSFIYLLIQINEMNSLSKFFGISLNVQISPLDTWYLKLRWLLPRALKLDKNHKTIKHVLFDSESIVHCLKNCFIFREFNAFTVYFQFQMFCRNIENNPPSYYMVWKVSTIIFIFWFILHPWEFNHAYFDLWSRTLLYSYSLILCVEWWMQTFPIFFAYHQSP